MRIEVSVIEYYQLFKCDSVILGVTVFITNLFGPIGKYNKNIKVGNYFAALYIIVFLILPKA